jgi:CheY-like chemotaxis protein
MKAIMEKAGLDVNYQVDFCITGLEAFDLVKETYISGMSYKLILTDFNMPVMDGIKSTQKIREFLTNT